MNTGLVFLGKKKKKRKKSVFVCTRRTVMASPSYKLCSMLFFFLSSSFCLQPTWCLLGTSKRLNSFLYLFLLSFFLRLIFSFPFRSSFFPSSSLLLLAVAVTGCFWLFDVSVINYRHNVGSLVSTYVLAHSFFCLAGEVQQYGLALACLLMLSCPRSPSRCAPAPRPR